MRADSVDIWNELLEVEVEVGHLAAAIGRSIAPCLDAQSSWERSHMLGSGTEKVYTGCERVMSKIASLVDASKVGRTDGWHATLLLRMVRPFPGVREAIITPETFGLLDRLRSFRHRERNSYGFNLDPTIIQERSREAVEAFALFKRDVKRFIDVWSHED